MHYVVHWGSLHRISNGDGDGGGEKVITLTPALIEHFTPTTLLVDTVFPTYDARHVS